MPHLKSYYLQLLWPLPKCKGNRIVFPPSNKVVQLVPKASDSTRYQPHDMDILSPFLRYVVLINVDIVASTSN